MDLVRGRDRHAVRHPDEPRGHLRPQVGLGEQELREGQRVEGAGDRRHHLVAGHRVGHRVHADRRRPLVAREDVLDHRGGQVLAVDPEAVVGTAGEVEVAVGVAAEEVARPVPASPTRGFARAGGAPLAALRLRRRVAPVALEGAGSLVDQFADRLVPVEQPARRVEAGRWALPARLRVQDHQPGCRPPDRSRRRARRPLHGRPALRRAVSLDQPHPEPPLEGRRVHRARLRAEAQAEGVVAVPGVGGGGQDVLDRPADVGEVGRPVTAYVRQEAGRREAAAQSDGRPGDQRGCPVGDHRVAVEHRHADVVDVVRTQGELAGQGAACGCQAALGAERGLGRAGRAGGEVEQEAVGRGRAGRVRPGVRVGGQEVGVVRRVRHQQAYPGQVQVPDQRQVGPLGDQDAALGVQDVAGQFGAAAGGVDAGDRRPGQGSRAQPERELGGVVEQHPDVGFGAGRQKVGQQRGPGCGARRHLVVGQYPVLVPQPRPVVAPPAGHEFRDRTR